MTERMILTEHDRKMMVKFIEGHKLPMTIKVEDGRRRSVDQNRLGRLWYNEISEQLGDQTPEEVRGFCKAMFGVPILCEENEKFREHYDRVVRPLGYETKLALMQEPLDLPVTRIMTTKQKTRYLDCIQQYFAEKGIILTQPMSEAA